MKFNVIVTLGPSTMKADVLKEIDATGPCIYRINGAHSSGKDVLETCKFVRNLLSTARLMIDLPGNKVRTRLSGELVIKNGEEITLSPDQLNYRDFYKHIKIGDKIFANDSVYTLEVAGIDGAILRLLSHSDGVLGDGKGLHIRGIHDNIPFVFEKDIELLEAASQADMDYVSLSFVRTAEDIREVKRILADMGNKKTQIFAKVETLSAVKNLGHIFQETQIINVDRGDLSTDVGLIELSSYQERIIDSAKRAGREIYLATQFLKNMERYPVPLIAEIIDLHKTIKSGVNGIQLSEETAVGKYPVECVRNVFKVYYNSFSS